ncbi:MAG: DUF374 domain-containing protein [Puniceicoccales bacterium]|jgi:lysophospholipid acyltransferase (LPLAT)-like uncharacterized protein|nr:DUF374 domain-containing protein [Puniceicoccales bacterium]
MSDSFGVKKLKFHERMIAWLIHGLLRIWWSTLRICPGKNFKRLCRTEQNYIFALWHQNIFIASILYHRFRKPHPMRAMISASKDGGWLSELFRLVNIGAIRGSSHRGALGAYYHSVKALRNGDDVTITPDGPRGPKFQCKPGVLRIAMEENIPILAIRVCYGHAHSLGTWDRFKLPLPFSKVCIAATAISKETLSRVATEDGRIRLLKNVLSTIDTFRRE